MTGGIDAATAGFQSAQQSQALADPMAIQAIGLIATTGLAASLEWALTAGLGRLGVAATRIDRIVEVVENPINTAAQGAVNVTGAAAARSAAEPGQTPTPNAPSGTVGGSEAGTGQTGGRVIGSPTAFLSQNLEHDPRSAKPRRDRIVERARSSKGAAVETHEADDGGGSGCRGTRFQGRGRRRLRLNATPSNNDRAPATGTVTKLTSWLAAATHASLDERPS